MDYTINNKTIEVIKSLPPEKIFHVNDIMDNIFNKYSRRYSVYDMKCILSTLCCVGMIRYAGQGLYMTNPVSQFNIDKSYNDNIVSYISTSDAEKLLKQFLKQNIKIK